MTSSFISFHFTLFSEREPSESYPTLCGTVVTLNNSILPSFSLFSMVPKHLECARPCQHSDSGEIEANVLGNPRKSDHWTCNTIFSFFYQGDAGNWEFPPNHKLFMGRNYGEIVPQIFLLAFMWLVSCLPVCRNLLTGLRIFQRGNYFLYFEQVSPWDEGMSGASYFSILLMHSVNFL